MTISSSSVLGSGGLIVTPSMRKILEQPGYLGAAKGGETLRHLYCDRQSVFFRLFGLIKIDCSMKNLLLLIRRCYHHLLCNVSREIFKL
jgi:hypothetical protein